MAGAPGRPPIRGRFRDDLAARAVYAEGAGIARMLPQAVAVPADAADVSALVGWARASARSLVPRGSGSGMAGGAVGDGVIADLSRIDTIGPVDAGRRLVRCGPGAIRQAVNAAARAHGLRFPVDPSSGPFCTVGGMAAANAAGARSLRFGATRSWVQAIECVLADGSAWRVARGEPAPPRSALEHVARNVLPRWRGHAALHRAVKKNSSGYHLSAEPSSDGDALIDLLVGSEGTLALFTALELRLTALPAATASALAEFASLEGATEAAARAAELGASACELLDRTFLDVAAAASPIAIAPATETVLLIEVEGDSGEAASEGVRAIGEACWRAGASRVELALGVEAERALWELRHAASPTLAKLDPSLKSMQFIEDGCVPPDRLPEYVRGVRRALAGAGIRGVIFGHAGDANVHVNPLVDVTRPDWREAVARVLDEVTALVASLGGTLAGEHGDGRLRTPLLPRVWSPEALQCFAEIKVALDPAGTLNSGVKVGAGADWPPGAIKYDPDLAPLPAAARRALDVVERERGYAADRLTLLDDAGA